MPLLLDTQLLLWWAVEPARVPPRLRHLIADPAQDVVFSVASLWEVAIKASLGRADFQVDGSALRRGLRLEGFGELPISAEHALAVRDLPWIHRDPFDRLLIAQALQGELCLLTCDAAIAAYGPELPALRLVQG